MNKLVYKNNSIIKASYSLNLAESRLVLSCIAQIKSDEKISADKMFMLSVSDYAKLFNLTEQSAYKELYAISDELLKKILTIIQDM